MTDAVDAPDSDFDDASDGELVDPAWLLAGNDYPPEYYIQPVAGRE